MTLTELGEAIVSRIIYTYRDTKAFITRDIRRDLNMHTSAEIFYLERKIDKLEQHLSHLEGSAPLKKRTMSKIYNDEFYRKQCYASYISALHVLTPLIKKFKVNSAVDFGCGAGSWLYAAKHVGVEKVLGFDGDYVDRGFLLIDADEFIPCDLSKPVHTEERFDMAMSLEVAEHLPASAADDFVASICEASDLVLFSAAHPGQLGPGHINCQAMSYWEKKFNALGYKRFDIRPYYMKDSAIELWYRQNMSLFIKRGSKYLKKKIDTQSNG